MQQSIPQNILIVTKAENSHASKVGENIAAWLSERGVSVSIAEHTPTEYASDFQCCGDLVVVLGGDGTIISVARAVAGRSPMLGLNMGRLGFLTAESADSWQECLEGLFNGGFRASERVMLSVAIVRSGKEFYSTLAVNDAVVNRGHIARLIRLGVDVDGELLGSMRADGLVVASPTGSTAYSVSSGGPIVHPELDVLSLTPICPFLHTFRPMVVGGDSEITVRIEEPGTDVFLTVDGQVCLQLEEDDVMTVRAASERLTLFEPASGSYLGRLRAKGVVE